MFLLGIESKLSLLSKYCIATSINYFYFTRKKKTGSIEIIFFPLEKQIYKN